MYTALFIFFFVSLAAAVPDCPSVDGENPTYFPHETSCSYFYECSNGIPYVMECPKGLEFNNRLKVCDRPGQAGCRSAIDLPETPE